MISTGQLIFAILFFVAFVIFVTLSYRKDRKLHRKYYKGNIWVLVGFVIFFLILLGAKYLLTR